MMQPTRFEIPEQIREAASKGVGQARKAVEQFLDATQKAVPSGKGSVGEEAADLSREALAFVEENVAASFELAQRLVQARTVEEVAALQQEFVRRQMAAFAEQGAALSAMAQRAGGNAAQSKGKPARK